MSEDTWHVIHERDILRALREVKGGADPEEVLLDLRSSAEAKEDYRRAEGIGHLDDPFETNDPGQLLRVIEIQRNALEFLMREIMEKNGEDTADVAQRVDFLLSQPLG